MDFTTIQIGIEKSVARVALNRPECHNAFNPLMIKELTEAVEWLDDRDDIMVIEICGNGKSFCAGADIRYMKEMVDYDYNKNLEDARRLSTLFKTIYFCNTVVISVVHGACIGGANGIAAASDIVLADNNTLFAFSEVKLGMTPATISPFIVGRCGEAAARELMLTGRKFTAAEAVGCKLVNFIGNDNEVSDKLNFYIKNVLEASPNAVRECKKLLRAVSRRDNFYDEIYEVTSAAIARQRISSEAQEKMKKFIMVGS